jgi:cation diffusion facilitator family transporter
VTEQPADSGRTILWLAGGSIVVSIVVLALKYAAYTLTGSVALLSDAIESIINVVTAVATLIAVRISQQPADAGHPYGHTKAEYLSAVIEGVLILIASLAILREAYHGFVEPRRLAAPALGLSVSMAATILNGAWSWLLIRTGRRRRSPALIADGRHLLTDVWTSGGVVVGVMLVALTGWQVLDPALAALIAINILWSGWQLIRESISGLMDSAVPEEDLRSIERAIETHLGEAIEAHDLRTRHAGRMTFVDFHLVVDGSMTVDASHAICDRLEVAIREHHPDSLISIHVEPEWKRKEGLTLPEHPDRNA